jgi:glycerol-3-phosphate dehydrogenase
VFKAPAITADELNIPDMRWAQRMIGRYGNHAKTLLAEASDAERQPIENTAFCLAECRWAARNESVMHLDDLLLRRTRLGSVMQNGGEALFPEIERICAQELQWNAERWRSELARYRDIWRKHYYLPGA